jgi:hypothetical protein
LTAGEPFVALFAPRAVRKISGGYAASAIDSDWLNAKRYEGRMTKRPTRRALLAAFCMVVCSTAGMRTAVAQQSGGNFSATVFTGGHKPVANVHVVLAGPPGTWTGTTDAHGFVSLSGVQEGSYTAAFSANGFGPAMSHVTINKGRTTTLSVTLAPELRRIGR